MKCARCGKELRGNQIFFGERGTPWAGKIVCRNCYYETLRIAKYEYAKRRRDEYSEKNRYRTYAYRTGSDEESEGSEEHLERYRRKEDECKPDEDSDLDTCEKGEE